MPQSLRQTLAVAALFAVPLATPPSARAGMIVLDFQNVNPTNADFFYFPGPYVSQGFTLSSTLGFNS